MEGLDLRRLHMTLCTPESCQGKLEHASAYHSLLKDAIVRLGKLQLHSCPCKSQKETFDSRGLYVIPNGQVKAGNLLRLNANASYSRLPYLSPRMETEGTSG